MMRLYAATLFASAMLLFIVEPMVGKMILPTFGGTPAAWNTCMVFFQAMLLAGYAYAHGSTAWLGVRRQAAVHLAVLLIPLALLPINLTDGCPPPTDGNPTFWLLGRLLLGVGVPFFAVSSSAPLLQKWFSATNHKAAADPYFLYGASNIGSLLALLSYPLLIERMLPLGEQSHIWMIGYGLLIVLVAACAVLLWRSPPRTQPECASIANEPKACVSIANPTQASSPADGQPMSRAWWILLSAIPSSLMLGATTHITTNLAAVPLLWVMPLAIYLLTFVLVFARRPLIRQAWLIWSLPILLLFAAPSFFAQAAGIEAWLVLLHLLLFFVAAMVCHGELARRRPGPSHLTEFYLLMSLGGVLGGLFNTIVAPQIFSSVLEYPLVMGLVCFVFPRPAGSTQSPRARRLDLILPAGLAVIAAAAALWLRTSPLSQLPQVLMIVFGVLALICFACKDRPLRFGLTYAVTLATLGVVTHMQNGTLLDIERNFFGVKRILLDPTGSRRTLVHGTTEHGSQSTDPAKAGEPLAYYHRSGPIGNVFAALDQAGPANRVGVIGLGIGTLACYAHPGQHFTFYEIDPAVERIARDRRYFSFLADSRGTCDVVLGDGRLTIARAPNHEFDLILLDAFSSDAVPTHLLSQEAVDLYLSKLKDTGLLVFHVSNRFFAFEPLLARLADTRGLTCLARSELALEPRELEEGKMASHYVVMARPGRLLSLLASTPGWRPAAGAAGVVVWTDQYCDIIGLLRTGRRLSLGPREAVAGPTH